MRYIQGWYSESVMSVADLKPSSVQTKCSICLLILDGEVWWISLASGNSLTLLLQLFCTCILDLWGFELFSARYLAHTVSLNQTVENWQVIKFIIDRKMTISELAITDEVYWSSPPCGRELWSNTGVYQFGISVALPRVSSDHCFRPSAESK